MKLSHNLITNEEEEESDGVIKRNLLDNTEGEIAADLSRMKDIAMGNRDEKDFS
jgi:hypothetical protein